ncbi:methyltransferase [Chitinophaga sp.]|uniref:tRNA1(Val) (adenine(37)-N6)-methyltransferase n=1 Tax=Chitinophaga sp. TaxID=1869181 RepID=UPI0031E1E91C
MANQFFRFKQFTVNQEDCAMKVCTDACLQGAYTGWYVDTNVLPTPRILDIGTGTGLLSLMLAQRFPLSPITAIELDTAAAGQAARNFTVSPWASRLNILVGDARSLSLDAQYDLIITNPPFYESDLKSPDQLRNQAMHTTTLNYEELLHIIDQHLAPTGVFSVLLPYKPYAAFEVLATQKGFYPRKVLHVKQSVNHDKFRTIAVFGRENVPRNEEVMAIKEAGNDYTAAFRALLQPYYLYL